MSGPKMVERDGFVFADLVPQESLPGGPQNR